MRLASLAQRQIGGIERGVGHVDLIGQFAREADAQHGRRGEADKTLSHAEATGKRSRDQSPRAQADSTSRALGPARTRIVWSLVRLRTLYVFARRCMCAVSQSMSWNSLAAADPYQTRVWTPVAGGQVGHRRLALDHAVMVQQVSQPNAAIAFASRHRRTSDQGNACRSCAGDLEPVEAVDLAEADVVLHVLDLGGDHVEGLVKVEAERGVEIRAKA